MRKINIHNVIDNSKMNKFFSFVWVMAFVALIFDGFDQAVYGVALPLLMKELHLSATVSGFLGSASLLGAVAGALIFGVLTDKLGRKTILITAVVLYSVFTGLCATISDNLYLFAAWRFMAGMGIGTVTPTITSMLSEYTPKRSRRSLLAMNGVAISVGMLVTPLLALVILPVVGWRTLFGLAFVGLLLIPLLLKMPETMLLTLKKGNKSEIASILTKADPSFIPQDDDVYEVNEEQKVKLSVGALFKDGLARNTILIWVMFFVNMFIISTFLVWLPKLVTMMGYSIKTALILSSTVYAGTILGTIVAGKFADKIGYKKTLMGAYALNGLFLLLMSLKSSPIVFGICLFFYGFTCIMQNMMYPFASANYPLSIRTTGMGVGASVTRFGGFLAPVIVGIFIAQGMTPVGVFRFLLIPIVVGIVASSLTRKPKFD